MVDGRPTCEVYTIYNKKEEEKKRKKRLIKTGKKKKKRKKNFDERNEQPNTGRK